MTERNTPVGPNPHGALEGVKTAVPTQRLDPKKCEIAVHIGIFFDGTGNALDGGGNTAKIWQHEALRKHSNVARLFRAYPDAPKEGNFATYVPGLGTPFGDIGENDPKTFGAAAGAGGDGRLNYGLLQVFNSVHRAISPDYRPMFGKATVKALCRNGHRGTYTYVEEDRPITVYDRLEEDEDEAPLKAVGMSELGGVLMSNSGKRAIALAFYQDQAKKLANLIANVAQKPVLKEIFIDVFGFSRGAAAARSFTNWLDLIFEGNRLFGVVAHVRFLGIFDSVASVGVNSSLNLGAEGHMSWGDAPYLHIPTRVVHCEHYVAMHENRPSFPLEFVEKSPWGPAPPQPQSRQVAVADKTAVRTVPTVPPKRTDAAAARADVAGIKPANCRQFAYPGVHCDVGGGYGPAEQGRWIGEENFEDFGAKPPYRTAAGNRPPWLLPAAAATPSASPKPLTPNEGHVARVDNTRVATDPYLEWRTRPAHPQYTLNDLDSRRVSQIPLNHMYLAARKAGVPLDKELAKRGSSTFLYDPFSIAHATQRAFDAFLQKAGGSPRPLREWLVPCLAWRYQVRDHYSRFETTLRGSAQDIDDLQGANGMLLLDIDAIENTGAWQRLKDSIEGKLKGPLLRRIYKSRTDRLDQLAEEAPTLLQRLKAHPPVDEDMARLFKYLCHDSYAGFRPYDGLKPFGFDVLPGSWEGEGYLRYRRRYEGDDVKLTQVTPPPTQQQTEVA